MITIEDTPKTALDFILKARLQFGNGQQIQALQLLRMAEEVLGLPPRECSDCDGEGERKESGQHGYCNRCGEECMHCSGGIVDCLTCDGKGAITYSRDDVYHMHGDVLWKILDDLRSSAAA